jgi:oligoendopeptidase F
MPNRYPQTSQEFMQLPWSGIEPFYQELASRSLDAANVNQFLLDWTALSQLWYEAYQRLYVGITMDTTDQRAEQAYNDFLDTIYPAVQDAEQRLKEKLLASGLQPEGFDVPLAILRMEAAIFRNENLPLLSEELKLGTEYDKIAGGQTVEWEGNELTLLQLQPVYQEPDRERRERAWRLAAGRQLADREAINELWGRMMAVRRQIAENAGLPDFRAYMWSKRLRFDYTPEDCDTFHRAIEQVVVPAAQRLYERRRQRLGVDQLRPWDLDVDPFSRPPLRPFEKVADLEQKTSTIFHRVDPQLGEYFEIMRRENLLDLENRVGKAPGGYCTDFLAIRRPFIFTNAVGVHDDVQTLIHEGGHAFHVFEASHLPYYQYFQVPLEFAEVASMGMELLAAPYLAADAGGFYTQADAARAFADNLERSLLVWPYLAVVDAFQHWAYTHPEQGSDPAACDVRWTELWRRFMPGVDWSGLEQELVTGWHRKGHIHTDPFYYVEYGLALLGALQVWRNALGDQSAAVAAYRQALALGYSVPLSQLFATAGARFAFDAGTLGEVVDLMLHQIDKLESKQI